MKLLLFVPSFNDQAGLPELVQKLVASFPEATVLVVDDGSEPAIFLPVNPTFEAPHVVLLRLANKEGLGLATRNHFGNSPFTTVEDSNGVSLEL
jgi:hypothetical protein